MSAGGQAQAEKDILVARAPRQDDSRDSQRVEVQPTISDSESDDCEVAEPQSDDEDEDPSPQAQ